MYETYFGMKCNPFKKDIQIQNSFEFADFKEVQSRLKYLLNTKGIGLIYFPSELFPQSINIFSLLLVINMLSACPTLKKNMFNSELCIPIFPYSLFVFISIHTKNIKINIIINTAKIDF